MEDRTSLHLWNCPVVFSAALLLLVLPGLAGAQAAPPPAPRAAGSTIIVNIAGPTQSRVRVELSGGSLVTPVETVTSLTGEARFTGLANGTYTVTPRNGHALFAPQSRDVTFARRRTARVRFTSAPTQAIAGMDKCVRCHGTQAAYSDWLQGPHGNFNLFNGTVVLGYADFLSPSFSYPADATKFVGFPNQTTINDELKSDPSLKGRRPAYCLQCHGPLARDNSKVSTFPLVNAAGAVDAANHTQAARPIVGCENCHGGGNAHITSPLRTAVSIKDPTAIQCGDCHNKNIPADHLQFHPEAKGGGINAGIYEAYQGSAHADSVKAAGYVNVRRKQQAALCSKCHSDEGARLYKDVDGDATALPALFSGKPPVTRPSAVQCRTCHNSHDPDKLLESASAATGTAAARSAQFNTCTNCHQLLDANDGKIAAYHGTPETAKPGAVAITTNHYDDPATQVQEGYNVNRGSETACTVCHNPHSVHVTINPQWAASGHADLSSPAWTEDDWKNNGTGGGDTGQQACQRCHTATGFANRVTNPTLYDQNVAARIPNNNFSYLTGLQNEVLYCNACHTDSAFNRRKISPVSFPSGLTADLPDDSNLCMACHQGRASKFSVDQKIAGQTPFTFTNIHYFAAAATFFGTQVKGGYEYDGKTYVGQNLFSGHGTNKNTCVKCHLREGATEAPDHHFVPEIKDCSGCHAGITSFGDIRPASFSADYNGNGNTTEGLKAEIQGLEGRLLAQIQSYATTTVGTPIAYSPSAYPYFFVDTNGNGTVDAGETTAYNLFDDKLLKAAYNYQVSVKEPCGNIHNAKYIIELLYDSLQDLGADVSALTRA